MPTQLLKCVSRCVLLLGFVLGYCNTAFTADDDAAITSSNVTLSWDGFSSVVLKNASTKIAIDIKSLPKASLTVGQNADLSTTVAGFMCGLVAPFIVNGKSFRAHVLRST